MRARCETSQVLWLGVLIELVRENNKTQKIKGYKNKLVGKPRDKSDRKAGSQCTEGGTCALFRSLGWGTDEGWHGERHSASQCRVVIGCFFFCFNFV